MTQPEARSAALYARVSTLDDQTPEVQLHQLRQYCQQHNFKVVGEYVDRGVSGSKASRPELDRLMTDAAAHKFEVVIVYKLDRFGRSLQHLVKAFADLEAWDVEFISQTDNIDSTSSGGRAMRGILCVFAQFEHDIIIERVNAGLALARKKHKKFGPASWKNPPRKKLGRPRGSKAKSDKPLDWQLYSQALQLLNENFPYRVIAERLGVSRMTVYNLIQRGKKELAKRNAA